MKSRIILLIICILLVSGCNSDNDLKKKMKHRAIRKFDGWTIDEEHFTNEQQRQPFIDVILDEKGWIIFNEEPDMRDTGNFDFPFIMNNTVYFRKDSKSSEKYMILEELFIYEFDSSDWKKISRTRKKIDNDEIIQISNENIWSTGNDWAEIDAN